MNKKGQLEHPIAIFVFLFVGLLIMAPIILKVVNSTLTPISSVLGNLSSQSGESVATIRDSFITFWDYVIISAFLINVILLFISAFLIDTHPVFLVLYMLFGFLIFIFAPMLMDTVDQIYDSAQFTSEVTMITMTDFLRTYFGVILLGIYFVSGIIIYAKIRSLG